MKIKKFTLHFIIFKPNYLQHLANLPQMFFQHFTSLLARFSLCNLSLKNLLKEMFKIQKGKIFTDN